MDVKSILEATREVLGVDADLSYITEKNLQSASLVEVTEIKAGS